MIKNEFNIFNLLSNKNNSIDNNKLDIIKRFYNNVKNIDIDTCNKNTKYCGKEGHWLEKKMGINPNSKNEPDIFGYEMKKESNKTTLGDYSASEYAFSKKRTNINNFNNWDTNIKISRKDFLTYFGSPNQKKNNRYSWSGKCVPTYNKWNDFGQILSIQDNNDIVILYSFDEDKRNFKNDFPQFLKKNNIMISLWKEEKMKNHINKKFNNKGFFICKKIDNKYQKISFGKPFDFNYFIDCIKNKLIIFDSGMYDGNNRNYSQFRGSNFWNDLIVEEYL